MMLDKNGEQLDILVRKLSYLGGRHEVEPYQFWTILEPVLNDDAVEGDSKHEQ